MPCHGARGLGSQAVPGALTMTRSGGVDNNFATSDGGGIYAQFPATATLTGTTIQGNRAASGGGIFNSGATVNLFATNCHGNSVGNC